MLAETVHEGNRFGEGVVGPEACALQAGGVMGFQIGMDDLEPTAGIGQGGEVPLPGHNIDEGCPLADVGDV